MILVPCQHSNGRQQYDRNGCNYRTYDFIHDSFSSAL
jgi:hypothetical protein